MRSNTMVPDSFLAQKMLLCAGEHAPEFLKALDAEGFIATEEHDYRCYRFWRFPGFGAIWTGIGSGCIEPLIWEILQAGTPIKSIVLVGTAGLIGNNPELCGKVYAVSRAHACATGVSPDEGPLKPRWQRLPRRIPRRSSLSTDQYYGLHKTTQPIGLKIQQRDSRLRQAIARHWRSGRLLEMEVAQFYFLCEQVGSEELQFLALKGVSNLDGRHNTQVVLSQQILRDSVQTALNLLKVQTPDATTLN